MRPSSERRTTSNRNSKRAIEGLNYIIPESFPLRLIFLYGKIRSCNANLYDNEEATFLLHVLRRMRCLLPAPEKHLFFGGRWPYAAGEYDVDSKAVRALSEVFLMPVSLLVVPAAFSSSRRFFSPSMHSWHVVRPATASRLGCPIHLPALLWSSIMTVPPGRCSPTNEHIHSGTEQS
jgi:hypothetical protein